MKKLALFVLSVAMLSACGEKDIVTPPVVPPVHSMANMGTHDDAVPPSMTAKTVKGVKCSPVSKATLATIEAGGVPVKIIISSARAYKPTGKSPYFVAARFTVDGGSSVSQVGVWALSTLKLSDAPRILAVDSVAQKSSFWPKANYSELKLSPKNKNITPARACL